MTVRVLTRRQMEEKLGQVFAPEQTVHLVDVLDIFREMEIERAADTRELKQGLSALTREVTKLAAAQQRTDERLAELAAAQQRTDERLAELAAAQQRTDERLAELAAAQQRTDERLAELAAAQQRTDESVAQLSRAVESLARTVERGLTSLREEVGALANRFGFSLEEFVAALLPPWLERNYGIADLTLERRYFDLGDGVKEEVDLVGTGRRDGQPLTALVECSTTIGGGGVRQLAAKLDRVAATIRQGEVARIIVAMNVHPTAEEAAAETGIWIVPYSRINRERG